MISVDSTYLKNALIDFQGYLNKYKNLSHAEMYSQCIDERLAKTLRRYNEHLDEINRDIIAKASIRVIRTISKIKKFEDKDVIQNNFKSEDSEPNENPFI